MTPPPLTVVVLAVASVLAGVAQMAVVAAGGADRGEVALAALVPLLFLATAAAARRAAEREMRRLERAALTDELTGLANARAFGEDVRLDLARAARTGGPLTLAMIDLDGLKAVNDSLGHQAGDARIRLLADALRAVARTSDRVYRLGGDEFAALLPGSSAAGGVAFARRLGAWLAAGEEAATATTGVAQAEGPDAEALVHAADLALLEGKRTRQRIVVSRPDGTSGS